MRFVNVPHVYAATGRLVQALGGPPPTPATIRSGYRNAITTVRPFPAPPAGEVSVSFEDGQWARLLTERHIFDNIFVGVESTEESERNRRSEYVYSSLDYLHDNHPELARIVDLLVTDVVVLNAQSIGGGSASHLPGLVCMSPGPDWTLDDYAETAVHEATHLALFVMDMVYRLYRRPASALDTPECYVVSAVKAGVPRPLDKALHSAVVAVPLMYMQHARGETALVDAFAKSLLECATGLAAKEEFFTPYGVMVVRELLDFARSLDFGSVKHAFTELNSAA
ncbi:aKG-HExxH-type peptide beta-hydroxylase [Actinomadura hibisca]|uniref:aKG-HExxH-type peptide beta-hydroxylase n=1 Tax=Actinomadura hibisca TaxID=68565 RepID=UPI00082ACDFB|nr:HEXXH motif-containing putative peptide modification protein [Actinomadura hibisca]